MESGWILMTRERRISTPYFSDDLIEEVRSRNDIVDVIGGYVRLQKKEVHILGYAPFIMRRRDHFPFLQINRCITALDVEREAMFLHF